MMVANSSNLIITVKPANQRTLSSHTPRRGSFSRNSAMSSGSHQSQHSASDEDRFDQDEIRDLTAGGEGAAIGTVGSAEGSVSAAMTHHHQPSKDEGVLHL